MSQDIELYKYNWDELIIHFRALGITNVGSLEDILIAFGEKCGNTYYLLNNEAWEEYNSYYNILTFITNYFNIKADAVHTILIKNRKYLDKMSQSIAEVEEILDITLEYDDEDEY